MDPLPDQIRTRVIGWGIGYGTGDVSRLPSQHHVLPEAAASTQSFDVPALPARSLSARAAYTAGVRPTWLRFTIHPTLLWGRPTHAAVLTLSPWH